MKDSLIYFKEKFDQLQQNGAQDSLATKRENAFKVFSKFGIPATKHEEWKYTRISPLFNKEYDFPSTTPSADINLDAIRLPGHQQANELVFVNGVFSVAHSVIRSKQIIILSLEEAAKNDFKDIIA